MPKMYIIDIEEKNLDLIEFLNNGVRPEIESKPTVFLCLIVSPTENTTAIMFKDNMYSESSVYPNKSLTYKDIRYADWVFMSSI